MLALIFDQHWSCENNWAVVILTGKKFASLTYLYSQCQGWSASRDLPNNVLVVLTLVPFISFLLE